MNSQHPEQVIVQICAGSYHQVPGVPVPSNLLMCIHRPPVWVCRYISISPYVPQSSPLYGGGGRGSSFLTSTPHPGTIVILLLLSQSSCPTLFTTDLTTTTTWPILMWVWHPFLLPSCKQYLTLFFTCLHFFLSFFLLTN